MFAIEQQEVCCNINPDKLKTMCSQHPQNLVYTGARNGSISRFDTRVDDARGQSLLSDIFKSSANSVTDLHVAREWQLVVGNIDGSVCTLLQPVKVKAEPNSLQLGSYDLRFARGSSPMMSFLGHNNSYSHNLVRYHTIDLPMIKLIVHIIRPSLSILQNN